MVFTSVTLFTAEAALMLAWLVGLGVGLWWLVRRARSGARRWVRDAMCGVTDRGLALFCWFEVVFVASWSVLFKLLLPVTPNTAKILSKGGSVYYASASEAVVVYGVLVAFVYCFRRFVLRSLGGDVVDRGVSGREGSERELFCRCVVCSVHRDRVRAEASGADGTAYESLGRGAFVPSRGGRPVRRRGGFREN